MRRKPFNLSDIQAECRVDTDCYSLDGRTIGATVFVPPELYNRYPYNATAYGFLQQLRQPIYEFGTIEFPGLPVNKSNYTVAMRHPHQHSYSDNPYLTRFCQDPHQDTPPHPTAFWLGAARQYSATWVMSCQGLQNYTAFSQQNPGLDSNRIHKQLLPTALADGSALLLNHKPGLLLIDNSEHQQLYHCRTSNFRAMLDNLEHAEDAPMYSYNEIGLLNYIELLDSRRGSADRDTQDLEQVQAFMAREGAKS